MGDMMFEQWFVGERRPKLAEFSAPSYCSQHVQLDFWPICTQNLNVRKLQKMCSRNNEELLYWPILNFYSEIWRTRKKTNQPLWRSRV
jgi:hypothetical protein